MPSKRPIVLIHGYSDKGTSFHAWRDALVASGDHAPDDVRVCNYQTLTNEVTIKDLAEGLDWALRRCSGLTGDEPFDAIVHSTGMLVVRAWLATYGRRRHRLKHLIGLAPATWGSPLAHKGRSWLGALVKGNDQWGPDFMEAGDLVLDGLELASRFTWDLAHLDFFAPEPAGDDAAAPASPAPVFFGPDGDTPHAFIFCGTAGYPGLLALINEPGTDGTVRLAGVSLDSRKIILDLARDPAHHPGDRIRKIGPRGGVDFPMYPVRGADHSSILAAPPPEHVDLVRRALAVESAADFDAWTAHARAATRPAFDGLDQWQHFVVRAVDERGDPITDYHVQLTSHDARGGIFGLGKGDKAVDLDVHKYAADPSLRSFHLNLTKLYALGPDRLKTLRLRVIASSGSALVAYHGVNSDKVRADLSKFDSAGKWDATLDIASLVDDPEVKLFHPWTTTLIELRLNRDPLPIDRLTPKPLFRFEHER